MAGKKKPPAKGNAKIMGAANKTTAGTVKADKPTSDSAKADELGRQAEALRLGEAVYRRVVDTMEDSLSVIDAEGTFLFANKKAALNLYGGAPSSVIGKNISRFLPKEQAEQQIDTYRRVIAANQPREQEVMVTLQGVNRWFLNSLRPVSFGAQNTPALISSSRDITERKKAEGALLDSETRYRTLFEQSGDYILVMKMGEDGVPVIMDMNETALHAHGYSREEMVGRPITFLDPVTDLHDNNERFKALKKGELELFTTQHRRRDGTLFDVEVRAQLIRIGGERVIVSTERDITERKRTEAALKTREKQLAESQRIAHIGSWERNLATGQMFWSEELFRLFGLDPKKDPVDFNMFFNMLHPDDRPALKKAVDETVKTGKQYSIDFRLILRDGTTRIIHSQAALMPDESGELVILSGTGQDITERKRKEGELRRVKADMELFFSVVPDLLCVASTDGYFKTLNHAWETTLGFTIPELLSKPFETWIHPDDVAPTLAEVERQKQGAQTRGFTNRYRCKDGSYRWLEWNVTPAYENLLYAAARDITERKRTEEALGASQSLLETIIDTAPT